MSAPPICNWKIFDDTGQTTREVAAVLPPKKSFAATLKGLDHVDIAIDALPEPCWKGDALTIQIPQEAYELGLQRCRNRLHGRVVFPKGSSPLRLKELREKLQMIWNISTNWSIISIGRGYFEFVFTNLEELNHVRAGGSFALRPGSLRVFGWTPDFSPTNVRQTTAQCWVRLYDLPQEYWSSKIILSIAKGLGKPICLDDNSSRACSTNLDSIVFGHYIRVLVDIDLEQPIQYHLWVERNRYAFQISVDYENLPSFCSNCHIIGHGVNACWRLKEPSKNSAPKKVNLKSVEKSTTNNLGKELDHVGSSKDAPKVMEVFNDGIVPNSSYFKVLEDADDADLNKGRDQTDISGAVPIVSDVNKDQTTIPQLVSCDLVNERDQICNSGQQVDSDRIEKISDAIAEALRDVEKESASKFQSDRNARSDSMNADQENSVGNSVMHSAAICSNSVPVTAAFSAPAVCSMSQSECTPPVCSMSGSDVKVQDLSTGSIVSSTASRYMGSQPSSQLCRESVAPAPVSSSASIPLSKMSATSSNASPASSHRESVASAHDSSVASVAPSHFCRASVASAQDSSTASVAPSHFCRASVASVQDSGTVSMSSSTVSVPPSPASRTAKSMIASTTSVSGPVSNFLGTRSVGRGSYIPKGAVLQDPSANHMFAKMSISVPDMDALTCRLQRLKEGSGFKEVPKVVTGRGPGCVHTPLPIGGDPCDANGLVVERVSTSRGWQDLHDELDLEEKGYDPLGLGTLDTSCGVSMDSILAAASNGNYGVSQKALQEDASSSSGLGSTR